MLVCLIVWSGDSDLESENLNVKAKHLGKSTLVNKANKMWLLLLKLGIGFSIFGLGHGQKVVTFYEDYNMQGRKLHFPNIRTCTPLPPTWQERVSSIDTHDNCLIFYDTPICKGRFMQFKTVDDEPRIIPHLKAFAFNDMIKSVRPCDVKHIRKLPGGTYKIQNVANGKYLTARNFRLLGWTQFKTMKWKKEGSQQWNVKQNDEGNYYLIPRSIPSKRTQNSNQSWYILPYDPKLGVAARDREEVLEDGVFRDREIWDLRYLHGDVSMIRNVDTKECLVMKGDGQITQSRCNRLATNQQWIFHDLS